MIKTQLRLIVSFFLISNHLVYDKTNHALCNIYSISNIKNYEFIMFNYIFML